VDWEWGQALQVLQETDGVGQCVAIHVPKALVGVTADTALVVAASIDLTDRLNILHDLHSLFSFHVGGSVTLTLVIVVIVDADHGLLQHKADDERTDDSAAIHLTHGIIAGNLFHG